MKHMGYKPPSNWEEKLKVMGEKARGEWDEFHEGARPHVKKHYKKKNWRLLEMLLELVPGGYQDDYVVQGLKKGMKNGDEIPSTGIWRKLSEAELESLEEEPGESHGALEELRVKSSPKRSPEKAPATASRIS